MGNTDNVHNMHSVLLGVLLGLMLPPSTSWWIILCGCFLMVVLGKNLFGGLGSYPVHPVILSLAMLQVSWPKRFDLTQAHLNFDWPVKMIDPLQAVKSAGAYAEGWYDKLDLLLGSQVAEIGTGMTLYILAGGLLLLALRQIPWQIPVSFLAGVLLMGLLFYSLNPDQYATPVFHLLTGGTMLAAFFLITDSTTSPVNQISMLLYGFTGGVLLVLIRSLSSHINGLAFTILLINIIAPLLDKIKPSVKGIKEISHA